MTDANGEAQAKLNIQTINTSSDQQAINKAFVELEEYLRPTLLGVIRNKRLIDYDPEDFYQIALTEIFMACQSYDPARAVAPYFATIARNIVNTYLGRGLSKSRYNPRNFSINGFVKRDGTREGSLADLLTANGYEPVDALASEDNARYIVERLRAFLSDKERQVFWAFLSNTTNGKERYLSIQQQIKERFGRQVSVKSIDNCLQRIREKAKKLFLGDSLNDTLGL
jgi:RNA polymerase sigma factor (sigma-70 family)